VVAERQRLRGWRKIANATWGHPSDSQIYGDLEIDATALLEFAAAARAGTGLRITLTHLVGKAVARALADNPDLNIRLSFGRVVPRETVDIFFIVSADEGRELTGIKIERADEKPVVEIARELGARAQRIHGGDDAEFGRAKAMLERSPIKALAVGLRLLAWLANDLNMDLKVLGVPRQTFGGAMISSVGMFGIQHAYAPLSPIYRVPLLVLVGEVAKRPVVVDDDIAIRPIVTLAATLDHRYLDGFHAARLARTVQAYAADPWAHEPPLEETFPRGLEEETGAGSH
jgi:hypothetical protein